MDEKAIVVREVFLTAEEWRKAGATDIIKVGFPAFFCFIYLTLSAQLVHREAITHSQLKHPNILPFLGVYHDDTNSMNSCPLTIVPYIRDGSLQGVLDRGELDNARRLKSLLLGIMKGVSYLHTFDPPVIHGDLHPGNILLDKEDSACVCDFGLSRIRHEVSRTRTKRQGGGLTRFLAPELNSSEGVRFKTSLESDIYSLAMLLFNMWTGEKPFSSIELEWKVSQAIDQEERPERPLITKVEIPQMQGDQLWELINDMWEHIPASRPTTSIVARRLLEVLAGLAG
ncbi:kinase-like protein [Clavulina sp. PMI_390]|nr:kinase-like protein [Clavulina sp. PMI_390]